MLKKFITCAAFAGWTLVATGCTKAPAPAGHAAETEHFDPAVFSALTVQPLSSPTTGVATSPQLTVGGGHAIVSWLETANFRPTLKFSERTAEGWSEPQAIVSGKDFVNNPADVPSVRALKDGTLVAHWNQQYDDDEENYALLVSWSSDGGKTWAPGVRPHHDDTKTQHGFGTFFETPGSGFGIVWLDGRATRPDAPESANNMALWAATFGADRKEIGERQLDSRVCDCCQTSVAETADGALVAYRDRSPDEVRDIFVARLANGQWSDPVSVHADRWKINGCPVNGPAIDARSGKAAVAWFTAATGEGQSFLAFSTDGGRTFGAPIRIDDGNARGHVQVALLADGSAAVTWTEAREGRLDFKVRRIDAAGQKSPAVTIARIASTEYPRLARGRDELLFAWVENEDGYSRLHTARADLTGGRK